MSIFEVMCTRLFTIETIFQWATMMDKLRTVDLFCRKNSVEDQAQRVVADHHTSSLPAEEITDVTFGPAGLRSKLLPAERPRIQN